MTRPGLQRKCSTKHREGPRGSWRRQGLQVRPNGQDSRRPRAAWGIHVDGVSVAVPDRRPAARRVWEIVSLPLTLEISSSMRWPFSSSISSIDPTATSLGASSDSSKSTEWSRRERVRIRASKPVRSSRVRQVTMFPRRFDRVNRRFTFRAFRLGEFGSERVALVRGQMDDSGLAHACTAWVATARRRSATLMRRGKDQKVERRM